MANVPTKLHLNDTLESLIPKFGISLQEILKINGNIPNTLQSINNWVVATGGRQLQKFAIFTDDSIIFLPERNNEYLQGKPNQSLESFRQELASNKSLVDKVNNARTKPPSFEKQNLNPNFDLSKYQPRTAAEMGIKPTPSAPMPSGMLPKASGSIGLFLIVGAAAMALILLNNNEKKGE